MNELEAKLLEIWERRYQLTDHRLATIEQAAEALSSPPADPELRQLACMEAHRLAGSLGSFGLHHASSLAEKLELILVGQDPISSQDLLSLHKHTKELRELIRQGPA